MGSRYTWAIFILILLASGAGLWANGQKEDDLVYADRLIDDRQYNEAIRYLTDYMNKNPERWDEAQQRIQRIIKLREEYNKKATELLDVIINEPTADEKKLSMIKDLEALEKKPNLATETFIKNTKDTALFTLNKSKYDDIMKKGRDLIDSRQYVEAVALYESGFLLYKEQFDEAGYGDIVEGRVNSSLEDIKSADAAFSTDYNELERLTSALEAALAGGTAAEIAPILAAVEGAYLDFASRRNRVALEGRKFESQFALLQQAEGTLTESSFLPFAFRFTLGRKNEPKGEGILGSMDTLWGALMARMEPKAYDAALRSISTMEKSFSEGVWARAKEAAAGTEQLAGQALRITGLWSAVAGPEIIPTLTAYGKSILIAKAPRALFYQHASEVAEKYGQLASLMTDIEDTARRAKARAASLSAAPAPIGATVAEFTGIRDRVLALQGGIDSLGEDSRKLIERFSEALKSGYLGSETTKTQGAFDAFVASSKDKAIREEVGVVALRARLEYEDLARAFSAENRTVDKAKTMQEGIASEDPKLQGILLRYPTESVALIQENEATLGKTRQDTLDFISKYLREKPYAASDPQVAEWMERGRQLTTNIAALVARGADLIVKGKAQRAQADAAKAEAEARVKEVNPALAKENFDLARDRISKAREKYNQSLSLQEDSELREKSDSLLLELAQAVTKAENEKVIREVRLLITDGKDLYYQGLFNKAEDTFVQADARWKTTNIEDEPEISYWLSLVRSALSINTGRNIPVTAPLYPEMSQLLSLANQYFEQGRNYMTQKKKVEALKAFKQAEENLNQVKVVFPLNQEANILLLKIDQIIDPPQFEKDFAKRFQDAKLKLQGKIKAQEGYSELLDLQAIKPDFPGLAAAIKSARVQLGFDAPPLDPKKVTESNRLADLAQRIYDASERDRYSQALSYIAQALDIYPNNSRASALKDLIQKDVGGTKIDVLDAASEEKYIQAVQEFQKGNKILANSIVEQLLKDPKNQKSTKITELSKRIKASL